MYKLYMCRKLYVTYAHPQPTCVISHYLPHCLRVTVAVKKHHNQGNLGGVLPSGLLLMAPFSLLSYRSEFLGFYPKPKKASITTQYKVNAITM